MPNYCNNEIKVIGNHKDICKFIAKYFTLENIYTKNSNLYFDFNNVISEPETPEECPLKYKQAKNIKCIQVLDDKPWFDWYTWRLDNWGVKWNAADSYYDTFEYNNGSVELQIYFWTAWSPASKVYRKIIQDNPNLKFHFKYYEEGNIFGGEILSTKDGEFEEFYYDGENFKEWALEEGFIDEDIYNDKDNI